MPKLTTHYEKPGLYSNEAFKRAQCSDKDYYSSHSEAWFPPTGGLFWHKRKALE